MANFDIPRTPVPDWRTGTGLRPMADQVFDLVDQFDREKDMRSIGALTQGLRWVDQAYTPNDTVDAHEWQVAARAIRKVMGNPAIPIAERGDRLAQAFDKEAQAAKK